MARMPRIAAINIPYHVTQRGNARQFLLATDEERAVYLDLLQKNIRLHELRLIGYCLMSNHVHLVVIPQKADSLAQALKQTHGRYATYWNATHGLSGHVWQGRFYSCPLDNDHLWIALRYVERNPIRAKLVDEASTWRWSSAGAHCFGLPDDSVDLDLWNRRWTASTWKEYLASTETKSQLDALRQCAHSGRPLGDDAFVLSLEEATQRKLVAAKGGRNPASADRTGQIRSLFDV